MDSLDLFIANSAAMTFLEEANRYGTGEENPGPHTEFILSHFFKTRSHSIA